MVTKDYSKKEFEDFKNPELAMKFFKFLDLMDEKYNNDGIAKSQLEKNWKNWIVKDFYDNIESFDELVSYSNNKGKSLGTKEIHEVPTIQVLN